MDRSVQLIVNSFLWYRLLLQVSEKCVKSLRSRIGCMRIWHQCRSTSFTDISTYESRSATFFYVGNLVGLLRSFCVYDRWKIGASTIWIPVVLFKNVLLWFVLRKILSHLNPKGETNLNLCHYLFISMCLIKVFWILKVWMEINFMFFTT